MAKRTLAKDRTEILVHPLSYVRAEHGWSMQDLVEIIARRVGNMAARREKGWRWERWGVVPDDDAQLALAHELGVPSELVRTLGWPAWLPVGEPIDTELPWTASASITALDRAAGSAVMDRRGFLVLGSGAAATMAQQWLTIDPPDLAAVLNGGRLHAGLVRCFEQRLPGLRQMSHTFGGGRVRTLVDTELRLATDLLMTSSYTERIGLRMISVVAELGRLAGWTSFDAGYHAGAERYWVAALRAAHAADDRALGANILKCMSLQRVDAGRPDEAVSLAQAARAGAAGAPSRVIAMLTLRQARAHAVRGEATESERLLAKADRAMAHADGGHGPSWARYFDHAEYCAQVAACYLALGRHPATERWLSQSLTLQPKERSRDRATYLMWQARTALSLGDVERACSVLTLAIPDITATRSMRNKRRLGAMHTSLRPYRQMVPVQELDERIKELIA